MRYPFMAIGLLLASYSMADDLTPAVDVEATQPPEIGRASCRERV